MILSALLAAIKECGIARNLERGRRLHEQAIYSGHDSNKYVAGSLLSMYAKCGRMEEARMVFDSMRHRDVVPWTALAMGYAENGQEEVALEIFGRIEQPNALSFVAAMRAVTGLALREAGRLFHGRIVRVESLKRGEWIHSQLHCLVSDMVANSLLDMYAKCGCLERALWIFERMPCHSIVSWNALVLGCAENDEAAMAVELFERMVAGSASGQSSTPPPPNGRSFVSALKACSVLASQEESKEMVDGRAVKSRALERGKWIHLRLSSNSEVGRDHYVSSALLDFYAKCGSMVDARRVFDRMPQHDSVTLNALLLGYTDNGEDEMALELFLSLSRALSDGRSFVAPLKACSNLAEKEQGQIVQGHGKLVKLETLERGMLVHSLAVKSQCETDVFVASILVTMYARCGSMVDARKAFDRMPSRNVVSWNSLILGYSENGEPELAIESFESMELQGNSPTFLAALKACSSLADKEEASYVDGKLVKAKSLEKGAALHVQASRAGCDSDTFVANCLVDMYAKCGDLAEASRVFESMSSHSVVSFNALMLAYAENQQGDVTLSFFSRMVPEGCQPNALSYVAAIKACSSLVTLDIGKGIQAQVCRRGLESDPVLEASLVDVFGKCGSMMNAQLVFDSVPGRDPVTWTSLMEMKEQSLRPDAVTFIAILTACSHAGLVERGKGYFREMSSRYGVEPQIEHYSCMVDILGRANRLPEAVELLERMPVRASRITWSTLLGASKKWKNLEVGRFAFDSLMALDDSDPAAYVLMSNLYNQSSQEIVPHGSSS
ncbi:pentatricopeptide repeat-containing protein At1g11290, chloroplastic-like [Selaginella moellendorffii]|uniref:pentatricopeptide repeat-containing protein At1g11290, chloroplastic-like n=1 Tax=Selaginella moellendorffii TaxID=88036 RepID=UPI000D1CAD6A|nr:pentatricopeptide repeat-containing protein At1g11290, chloroplastic-like [Selaginella moellendorffii]|eukprot:XP_024542737.1 pentatricopeptide repeat-containing protein At1g11290, chloroplastic-like [Selaginella moellendorffii]